MNWSGAFQSAHHRSLVLSCLVYSILYILGEKQFVKKADSRRILEIFGICIGY